MEDFSTNEIVFMENEYDHLENRLLSLESPQVVYRVLANFLARKFGCTYVLFYSDVHSDSGRVLNYGERVPGAASVSDIVAERRAYAAHDRLLKHRNRGFSVPFRMEDGTPGCIFVGPRMDGTLHTMNAMREMIPVVRTLNHVLVYLEAMKSRRERDMMRFAFSKYVSSDVVESLIENPEEVELGGKRAELSVIFTDLREFTSLSETLAPENLVKILNMYFSEMSEVIFGLGGTIDKFEGDAIMAFFGAPHTLVDHAVRCCLAALRLRRMERILNEQLVSSGLVSSPLYTRIGVNSGDMVVGNIGSASRFEYTIIGSNVNIASRIEDCNKKYGTQILISGRTFDMVKDFFVCRFVERTSLKGVSAPVDLYELVEESEVLLSQIRKYDRMRADDCEVGELIEL